MKYLIPVLLFCLPVPVLAQVSTQPVEPVQPPWFFYWPSENADNFENSDLGSSTLGTSNMQRRSNIEVNRREDTGESSNYAPNTQDTIDVDLDEPSVNTSSRPPSSAKMVKWVDDNGVVHVTNDPGSIPEKYRNQIEN